MPCNSTLVFSRSAQRSPSLALRTLPLYLQVCPPHTLFHLPASSKFVTLSYRFFKLDRMASTAAPRLMLASSRSEILVSASVTPTPSCSTVVYSVYRPVFTLLKSAAIPCKSLLMRGSSDMVLSGMAGLRSCAYILSSIAFFLDGLVEPGWFCFWSCDILVTCDIF